MLTSQNWELSIDFGLISLKGGVGP